MEPDKTLSRRERKKLRTREAILDAARRHFAEKGVNGVRMEEIAETADIARATLFNYFPSRGEIVAQLVADYDDSFFERLEIWRMRTRDPVQRMRGLLVETGRRLVQAPGARAIISASEASWNEEAGERRMRRLHEAFARLLDLDEEGGEGAAADGVTRTMIVEAAVSIYVGVIHNWRLSADYDVERHLAGAAQLIGRLMRS